MFSKVLRRNDQSIAIMKSKEQFIEDALKSVESLKGAQPAPYLLTRVKAKLIQTSTNNWDKVIGYINRPLVIATGLCFILLINLSAVLLHSKSDSANKSIATNINEQDEVSVANFYDIENTTP